MKLEKQKWRRKNLGDLCLLKIGKTPSRGTEVFWDKSRSSGNVWLSIADLLNVENNVVSDSKEYISKEGAELCKIVKEGTLLVSFKLTLGRLAFAGRDLFTNEAIAALSLNDESEISKHFLFYWLYFFDWKKAAEHDAKIKGMTLNKDKLRNIIVEYPPLPEQQRIVSILDQAFDAIDQAKALTQQNLRNAQELFESYLNEVFTRRGDGWVENHLGNICMIARGGSPRPIQHFLTNSEQGVNWIKIGDATASGKFIYKTEQKIKPEGVRYSRMVYEGDFLLSNSMSFGRPYIMGTSGCIHDGWLVLSNYKDHLERDYLYHLLNSSFVFSQFNKMAAGSTVRNLNIESASKTQILIPPKDQQNDIAISLNNLKTETQRLAELYTRKLAALDELKKALLRQAFEGDL